MEKFAIFHQRETMALKLSTTTIFKRFRSPLFESSPKDGRKQIECGTSEGEKIKLIQDFSSRNPNPIHNHFLWGERAPRDHNMCPVCATYENEKDYAKLMMDRSKVFCFFLKNNK